MKLIVWKTPVFDVKWLVCDSLVSECGSVVLLSIAEHHVVPPKPVTKPIEDPLERMEAEASPIVETAKSRKWNVLCENVVAFKSESESYSSKSHWPAAPERGRSFILEDSPWIAEFREYLRDVEPNCKHFVLFTDHAIIEVISGTEPKISEQQRGKRRLVRWLSSFISRSR